MKDHDFRICVAGGYLHDLDCSPSQRHGFKRGGITHNCYFALYSDFSNRPAPSSVSGGYYARSFRNRCPTHVGRWGIALCEMGYGHSWRIGSSEVDAENE